MSFDTWSLRHPVQAFVGYDYGTYGAGSKTLHPPKRPWWWRWLKRRVKYRWK